MLLCQITMLPNRIGGKHISIPIIIIILHKIGMFFSISKMIKFLFLWLFIHFCFCFCCYL